MHKDCFLEKQRYHIPFLVNKKKTHPNFSSWLNNDFKERRDTVLNHNMGQQLAYIGPTGDWRTVDLHSTKRVDHFFHSRKDK